VFESIMTRNSHLILETQNEVGWANRVAPESKVMTKYGCLKGFHALRSRADACRLSKRTTQLIGVTVLLFIYVLLTYASVPGRASTEAVAKMREFASPRVAVEDVTTVATISTAVDLTTAVTEIPTTNSIAPTESVLTIDLAKVTIISPTLDWDFQTTLILPTPAPADSQMQPQQAAIAVSMN
jgi:uncharacterized membrane protein